MAKWSNNRRIPRGGMTMIELIAAMTIFMIIVGALMVGTNNAFDTWRGASTRTRTLGCGRAALGLLTADLLQATTVSNEFELAWVSSDADAENTGFNRAEFDRVDAAPSATGRPADGRVIWRIDTTNNTSVLVREMVYTNGSESRVTQVLDGVTRLRFAPVWADDTGANENDDEGEDADEPVTVTEIKTNALPATVDVLMELVPAGVLAKAAGMTGKAKSDFIARQTLPLTTRVTYPHSRLPPLSTSTNMVTLSGHLYEGNRADNTPINSVTLELTGGRTDKLSSDGDFSIEARQSARPIRVTPQKPSGADGRFSPQWIIWRPAAGSRDHADFVWRKSNISIKGRVTMKDKDKAVPDVLLDFPMAGQVFTDEDGKYSIGVDSGWPYSGGTVGVTPVHPRYPKSLFEAVGTGSAGAYHNYEDLDDNKTERNYFWIPPNLVLTGEVVCAICREGLDGAHVTATTKGAGGLEEPRKDTTADSGRYRIEVPYDWSGWLTANWDDSVDKEPVGVWSVTKGKDEFKNLTESAYTRFAWEPTAVISGEVYYARADANTVPVTFSLDPYINCPDRVEILNVTNFAVVGNGTYKIKVPCQWYHTQNPRYLYVNPTHSLSNGGYYPLDIVEVISPSTNNVQRRIVHAGNRLGIEFIDPPIANLQRQLIHAGDKLDVMFVKAPIVNTTVDFAWIPYKIAVSGMVTNDLGGPVANKEVRFLSNCIDIAPTNVASYQGGGALLYTNSPAFAEAPWVYSATNGVWTNWVSVGWTGAILPVATNGTFAPPAVFVTGLTNDLAEVGFLINPDNIDHVDTIDIID